MEFNTETFIAEIERRPTLWDTHCNEHANIELRKRLWDELVDIFGPEDMNAEVRKTTCNTLQRKWKNIRNCFSRELRRLESVKSGSTVKRKSQYLYFDQLQFLKSTIIDNENKNKESNMSIQKVQEQQEEAKEICLPTDSRLRDSTAGEPSVKKEKDSGSVDDELIGILCKGLKKREEVEQLQSDEDRMFLLSLLPDLKLVPEYLKLKTKIDLMTVLDKAKRGFSSFDDPSSIVLSNVD